MTKAVYRSLLVIVAMLGFGGGMIWQANRPPPRKPPRSPLGAPVQLKRVNCVWDTPFLVHQVTPAACFSALSNYLIDHPAERIAGVLPIEPKGITTSFVLLLSAYGRLARDLSVEFVCKYNTEDCLTTLGKVTLYDANMLSWLVVNGRDGIEDVLRLRVHDDVPLPGSWDDNHWETGGP